MFENTKKILLSVADPIERSADESFLKRAGCQIITADDEEDLQSVVDRTHPDLAILDHRRNPRLTEQWCSQLRASQLDMRIIMILDPERSEDVDKFRQMQVDDIIFGRADVSELLDRTARLLSIPQRKEVRTTVRLAIRLDFGIERTAGQSLNISTSGMLIKVHEAPPLGSEIDFEFYLPFDDQPIKGSAVVVRLDQTNYKPGLAAGLRFRSLSPLDHMRITDFIETGRSVDYHA